MKTGDNRRLTPLLLFLVHCEDAVADPVPLVGYAIHTE